MPKHITYTVLLLIMIAFNACGGEVSSNTHNDYSENILRSNINKANFYALEVNAKNGIPVIAGDVISLDKNKIYYTLRHKTNFTKVKYSTSIENIYLISSMNNNIVMIPHRAKFIKIYFIENNNPASKVFEIFPSVK